DSIKQPTGFAIGCGFNPNVRNLQPELTKLKRKIDAGAQFVLTQLIFDPDPFVESVRLARQAGIEQPIFPAVSPLLSHRNAQFIHNELPGCRLPEHILQRMARHADDKRAARREGLAIAKQVIEQIWDHADGIYIVPPLSHYELAAELADFVRSAARTSQS
ncbi:MAG: methylenetetrahydrofolate reductase, partial [Phycisphaerae bacterium]